MFDIPAAIEAGSNMITSIVNRIAPDATEVEKNKMTLAMQELNNHYGLILGQLEINKAEAAHSSVFVAGWRPAIGWVGAGGLAYQIIFMPVINGIYMIFGMPTPFPGIDINLLQTMIGGMLGLGIARSVDKANGVDTKAVGTTSSKGKS